MVVMNTRRQLSRQQQLGLRLAGAACLAATGAIHLDLYLTGYNSLHIIGPLFLLQVIAAFALALAVLVLGGRPVGRLAAAAGAGFAVATLAGYLLSVWVGLFGFREVRTTAGIVAGVIEIAAFAVLGLLAALPAGSAAPAGGSAAGGSGLLARLQEGVPGAGLAIAAVSVVALVLLGVVLAGAGAPAAPASAGGGLRTAKVHGVAVVTNAKGFTLYWFAPDTRGTASTPAKSVCYGSCAAYWPPVKAPVTAGTGVTGKIGTIKRSDGSSQATYDGRPLYTYIGDSGPDQANGNNINQSGGLWFEVKVSG
jgi:predicted lipoprotein with Yx(FWY)xxD motif